MPQLNLETREITLKVVYYGPALSGKTTNLQQIHKLLAQAARGKMVSLDTQNDRTLYFDFLPVEFGVEGDYKIKLKLFTVPGQVMHRSTRRIVLAGADAVAFVADSQRSAASGNAYSYRDLETNLRANGIDTSTIAQVIQFNKRDLPDIKPLAEVREAWKGTGIPTVPAAALQGEGVLETFEALLRQLYQQLDRRLSFGSKFGLTEEDFLEGLMVHFQEKKPKS
ncbi:MAG: gliding motility protein [Deltaproteobacteria bacterium]|nr:MAG: gliding motility protein [Deltaproteobacteria bacterium]TDJ07456.1 MAG: gliding motility protein [Deltaproteobacteria bacterium]